MAERVTVADCIKASSETFGISIADIKSRRRFRALARARMSVCWLARHATDRSFPEIGRIIGIDHTSVLHAVRRVDELRSAHPGFAQQVDAALRRLINPDQAEMVL